MPAPSVEGVQIYLGTHSQWPDDEVANALAAEKAAQAAVCIVPADGADWPADLTEALYRRTSYNLAIRGNPLGVETAISEFGSTQIRVGGRDAEVDRLESPYRTIAFA